MLPATVAVVLGGLGLTAFAAYKWKQGHPGGSTLLGSGHEAKTPSTSLVKAQQAASVIDLVGAGINTTGSGVAAVNSQAGGILSGIGALISGVGGGVAGVTKIIDVAGDKGGSSNADFFPVNPSSSKFDASSDQPGSFGPPRDLAPSYDAYPDQPGSFGPPVNVFGSDSSFADVVID